MSTLIPALSHTWEPFVLVVGLLLVGHAAARDGLFEYLGRRCAQWDGSDRSLLVAVLVAVATVSALLNLDTAVVFMTPVALAAARSRSADEDAFLYGAILMSNAASLLLVGSNLTNLLVFSTRPVTGVIFVAHMLAPWLVSVLVTIVVVGGWRWSALRAARHESHVPAPRWRAGPGSVAVVATLAMMLALRHPALPVLGVGIVVELLEWALRRDVDVRDIARSASLEVVAPLFVLAVLVGWLGRNWAWPGHLVSHATPLASSAVAALASVLINNLPAASIFSGAHLAHPYAVLIGLDLGPNLFVSGAMSTMLWFRIARANGARPRVARFVAVGVPVAILGLLAATLAS
ncbi:MAG TPA: SLC13 family permease [Acidimicrobiales bacterium]